MTKSNFAERKTLDHMTGAATWAAVTPYIGLSTTFPAEDGTNVTEPSSGGYARANASGLFAAAVINGTTGFAEAKNSSAIQFATSTGTWASGADLVAMTMWDASSSGNLLRFDWLGRGNDVYFVSSGINTTTEVITTLGAHGFTSGDSVVIQKAVPTHVIPTGATANTRYYAEVLSSTTLKIHTNSGLSAAVNFTDQGTDGSSGGGVFIIFKILPRSVNAEGITLSFPSNQFILTED